MDNQNAKKRRYCIACLETTDIPVTLFQMKYGQSLLSEIFETCTSVKVQVENTNFSASICTKCLSELIAAHNFIKKCQQTSLELKNRQKNADTQPPIFIKLEENISHITEADNKPEEINTVEEKVTISECNLKEEAAPQTQPLNECLDEYMKNVKKKTSAVGQESHGPEEPEDPSKIQCEICFTTIKAISRKYHMMLHRGERPHVCEYCGKAFVQRIALEEHLKKHTGETPYVCQYCNKAFRSNTSYKWHVQIHSSTEKPVPCGVCDKVLRSQQAWKKHQLVHNKPFLCNLCGKRYGNKTQFTEHTNSHLGLKPHRCGTCNKTFSHKSKLKIHLLRHQEVKPYPCDLCSRGYVTNSKLSEHKKKFHCKSD